MAKSDKKSANSILEQYSASSSIEFKSTGIACLDELWGGGIDSHGCYSLWGPAGCGKSTLAFQIMKSFCKRGELVVFVDVEKAFNENQQKAFGLAKYVEEGLIKHLVISDYEELENVIEAVSELDVSLFVLDSETALTPVVSRDLKVTDNQPGLKAKQSSFVLTKLKSLFYKRGIPSIVIFHARANLNMNAGTVSDTKQAGGFAATHIPDVITKINTGGRIKEGDEIVGQMIRLMCEKSKYSRPFNTIEKKFIYGVGISKKIDLIDSCIESGVIKQGGAGYYTLPWGESIRGTKALYDLTPEQFKKLQDLT